MTERSATAAAPAPHQAKKSVENTVFVRFQPSSDALRRHHVQDVFSEVGPIKKCSVIHSQASGTSYGFVKFTAPEDAELAAVQLNRRQIRVDHHRGGTSVTVHCELAKQAGGGAAEPGRAGGRNHNVQKHPKHTEEADDDDNLNDHQQHDDEHQLKKTNRLILRNLSFYAKEKDIRQALEPAFGELLEVHIPRVSSSAASKRGGGIATHRGFAFVTLATHKAVKKCLKRYSRSDGNGSSQPLIIRDRPVQIARSLHKTAHQAQQAKQKQQQQQRNKPFEKASKSKQEEKVNDKKEDDEDEEESSSDEDRKDDDESSSSSSESEDDSNDEEVSDDDDDDDDDEDTTKKQSRQQRPEKDETAVQEKRCLFLRNLPFDCNRHDIFETFRPFGFITAIYIVKDLETHKIPRGTAFVSFQKPEQAAAALEAATAVASSSFVSQRRATVEEQWEHSHRQTDTSSTSGGGAGIVVKGRRLLVDLAVDKSTAKTLTAGEKKHGEGESGGGSGKDRRNLYLKGEGRVENDEKAGILAWDELPETDKLKRQTAWSEKNTKLRSPLFFINPNRLSFRNLAKHVDESDLKQLCVDAIQRGLERNLVTADDQIALWRASGEMTTREILARIQEADDSKTSILPSFDPKNVKQSIPSVHVHRDYVPGANKQVAPSRGFGFVEFEHHAHALACLREVNNNARYSAEFATGGKQAAEMKRRRAGKKPRSQPTTDGEDALANDVLVDPSGKVRTPRLIVEFTVENKAKAKQQAAHRSQQQANQMKQLQEQKQGSNNQQEQQKKTKKEKKSRGAKQRERKRKQLEEGGGAEAPSTKPSVEPIQSEELAEKPKKTKGKKPPKKQKVDKAEENFSKLVESYKKEAVAIVSGGEKAATKKNQGKRWFES